MIRLTYKLLLISIAVLTYSCSEAGLPIDLSEETTPPSTPSDSEANPNEESPPVEKRTTTILERIDTAEPAGKLCFSRSDLLALPTIEAEVLADGQLDEWDESFFFQKDFGGDSTEFDILEMATALIKHNSTSELGIALKGHDFSAFPNNQSEIYLKFGSLLKEESSNTTVFNLLRQYKITPTSFEKLHNGQYISINSSKYSFSVANSGFAEILIEKAELDEVVLQPLWSVEVEVRSKTSGDIEKTGRYFFKNILSYPTGLSSHLCNLRIGSQTVTVQEVVDEKLLLTEDNDDQPSDQKQKRIDYLLSSVREAFEASWVMLGKPVMQVNHHVVIFSEGPTPSVRDGLQKAETLQVNMSDITKLNPFFSKGVYEQAVSYFVRRYVDYQLNQSEVLTRSLVAEMLIEYIVRSKLGIKHWLENYQSKTNAFSGLNDIENPQGLVAWETQYAANELNSDAQDYFYAKITSIAMILARTLNPTSLISVLRTLKEDYSNAGNQVTYLDLFSAIDQRLQGTYQQVVGMYYKGWFQPGSYFEDHSPFLLSDEDLDGLPRFYELGIGTNPSREDTDRDGWTDLAEIYALSDPKSSTSKPNGIMADGSFGDWQELLPDLVENDNGTNSAGCPAAADISHHAALWDDGRLIIAAAGRDLWAEPPYVRWEVQVTFPGFENRTFTLKTVKNRYYYDVLEGPDRLLVQRYASAKPLGIDSMEWYLDVGSLGIDTASYTPESFGVTYRISTLYEDETRLLCDDTPWTQPIFSSQEEPAAE